MDNTVLVICDPFDPGVTSPPGFPKFTRLCALKTSHRNWSLNLSVRLNVLSSPQSISRKPGPYSEFRDMWLLNLTCSAL